MSIRFSEVLLCLALTLLAGCQSAPACQSSYPVDAGIDCDSEARFERAIDAMRAARYADAEPLLSSLTEQHPEWAGPWINLGIIRLARDDEAGSRAAFERALAASPTSCAAQNGLGTLDRRAGDFPSAEKRYRACLEVEPGFAQAQLNLGILLDLYMGRLEEAEAAYRAYQSLETEPDRRVARWIDDLQRRRLRGDS